MHHNQYGNLQKEEQNSLFVKWTSFFINKWRVTLIIILAIIIAGLFGTFNNQRQDFPTIPANVIVINAVYPGASNQNIEKEVIVPIEGSVKDIDNVTKIRATANDNFANLVLEMDIFEKDILNQRSAEVSDSISNSGIPEGVTFTVSVPEASGPTMFLGVVDDGTCEPLLECASEIKTKLESTSKEIKRVDIIPGDDFEVRVVLDAQSLSSNRLTYEQVTQIVSGFVNSLPGGNIQENGGEISIVVSNSVENIEDLKNLPITPQIKLSDISTVERVAKSTSNIPGVAAYRQDDDFKIQEVVYLLIYKTDNGDSVNISKAVKNELDKIKETNDISANQNIVILSDSADDVLRQINSLVQSAIFGLILILVILLFFINLRAAIVVSTILPLAFLITLFALYQIGLTINILTLFAMILALGILVDNAIVIAEGMMYEIEKGVDRKTAALRTVKKLGPAITSATLTTLIVFVPFATLPGILGEFLKFIPYTIIIMMVVSYFLAISITPLFGRVLLSKEVAHETKLKTWQKILIFPLIVKYGQIGVNKIADFYKAIVKRIYNNIFLKLVTIFVGFIVLFAGLYTATFIDSGQFPEVDSQVMAISIKLPAGVSNKVRTEVFKSTNEAFANFEDFESSYAQGGDTLVGIFTPPTERKTDKTIFKIVDEINLILPEIENKFEGLELEARSLSAGPPVNEFDIVVELKGQNLEPLSSLAEDIENYANSQPQVKEVENGYKNNLTKSISVDFDETALAENNLNTFVASSIIRQNFAKDESGKIIVQDNRIADDLSFQLGQQNDNKNLESLENLTLIPGILLSDVAEVKEQETLSSINRLEGEKLVEVSIKLNQDEDVIAFQNQLNDYLGIEILNPNEKTLRNDARVKNFGITEAEKISFGGAQAEQSEDFTNLVIVAILALIGVYIILVNQFNSYAKPALIMFTVIFAFAGVFPGLKIFGEGLNFISGLGVVALIGIAVNDAIVFIDVLNKLYEEEGNQKKRWEILMESGYQRFKPILSTTITTILGILPLTITDPFWRGLGIAIITGLMFSTIATLFLVPLIFDLVASLWNWIKRRFKKIFIKN